MQVLLVKSKTDPLPLPLDGADTLELSRLDIQVMAIPTLPYYSSLWGLTLEHMSRLTGAGHDCMFHADLSRYEI